MWQLISSLLSFGGSIYGGYAAVQSSKSTKGMMEDQARLTYDEARRTALRMREEGESFRQEQEMAYISSGVEIGGSSVVVLEQTRRYVEEEVVATERSGLAQKEFMEKQAKIQYKQTKASAIASIFGGASNVASSYASK